MYEFEKKLIDEYVNGFVRGHKNAWVETELADEVTYQCYLRDIYLRDDGFNEYGGTVCLRRITQIEAVIEMNCKLANIPL